MRQRTLLRQLSRILKKFPFDYNPSVFSNYMKDVESGAIEPRDQLYHNSTELAVYKIIKNLKSRWEHGLPLHFKLIAECQSGKTGVIALLLEACFGHLDRDEKLFTCGDASTALYEQSLSRISHLTLVEKIGPLKRNIKTKKLDVNKIKVLVIDEDQIAQGTGSRIHELMQLLYDLNPDLIVFRITATPAGQSHLNTPQIKIPSGEGYRGSRQFLKDGQIRDISDCYLQDGDYNGKKNAYFYTDIFGNRFIKRHLKEEIDRCINLKGVGVMRYTNPKEAKEIIDSWLLSKGISVEIYTVTTVREKKDNNLPIKGALQAAQEYARSRNKPVIIIIQEALKAGFTFDSAIKKKIVFAYETLEANWNSILQGLSGRCSGYHNNTKVHIYTNLQAIEIQKDWWEGLIPDSLLDSRISDIRSCKNPRRFIQPSTQTKISKKIIKEKNWMTAFPLGEDYKKHLTDRESKGELGGILSSEAIEILDEFYKSNDGRWGHGRIRISKSKVGKTYVNTKAWSNYDDPSDIESEIDMIVKTGRINREKFLTDETRRSEVNVAFMVYDNPELQGKNPLIYFCYLNDEVDEEHIQTELVENNFHTLIHQISEMLLN